MKISKIIAALEEWAPISYQESYDNCGLLVGNKDSEIEGVLCTLDVTEDVLEEAIENNCGLIVAHHPLIFGGIKKLNGKNMMERIIIKALKNDIAIYAIHTNLDNVSTGINSKIAEILKLEDVKILDPKESTLQKLTIFVPASISKKSLSKIYDAAYSAGAGKIGEYSECSFTKEGIGTFKPSLKANPKIGKKEKREELNELSIDFLINSFQSTKILENIRSIHPYEEMAYFLTNHLGTNQFLGSGMIGNLERPIPINEFLMEVKDSFQAGCIKFTHPHKETVQRVAICGGSGSFLLNKAIQQKADIFISSDFKYHQFFEAEGKIIIADIGHYETEQFSAELILDYIKEKFPNFALLKSKVQTNPVYYL